MNDRRKTTVGRHGPRWRVITALLALALCLAPLVAPAQQQDANRLPAGQLPTEADILQDPDLEGSPIDISFVDVDIRDVVRFFSQITGINLVLDPGVAGPVTMELFQVPWDAALEIVLSSHGLGVIVQRNIVRITSLTTLAEQASERARLQDQDLAAQPLLTQQVELSYAAADELLELTERQLSQRGDAVVDIRTNSLIIRDTEESIAAVTRILGVFYENHWPHYFVPIPPARTGTTMVHVEVSHDQSRLCDRHHRNRRQSARHR